MLGRRVPWPAFFILTKWCKVVHNIVMPQRPISDSEQTVRLSISISKDTYLELENISSEKKVSIAWVVRESIEKYLKEKRNEQK